jgi:hypothetical protein
MRILVRDERPPYVAGAGQYLNPPGRQAAEGLDKLQGGQRRQFDGLMMTTFPHAMAAAACQHRRQSG